MPTDKLCVVTVLDERATERICALQRLAGRGDDQSAHITVAKYDGLRAEALIPYAEAFCAGRAGFPVDFAAVGVFDAACIFAMPRVTAPLLRLHADFLAAFDEVCCPYTSLRGGKWTPHASLGAYSEANFRALLANFSEFTAHIVGLKIKDHGDGFRELATFRFGRRASPAEKEDAWTRNLST